MLDMALYQQVLGLTAPWKVTNVRFDVESTEIHVHVNHPEGCRWNCPQCSRDLACYDHAPERQLRHLSTCQFHTLVGITWDQAWYVLERAVARGLARKQATAIARIGVDEKAFRKGHRYLTIVNGVDRGTVEFVTEGRENASLAAFYESRTPEQLAVMEAVAMGMWEPYIQSTLEAVPLASSKIAFDRFHLMQDMTKAVDVVRRQENRLLIAEDDDRLKGTKYLWISSKEKVHPKRRAEFRFLRGSDLKTARA